MKRLLFFLLVLCINNTYGQTKYIQEIDSFCKKIDNLGDFYSAHGGDNFFDGDSNLTGFISIVYKYKDDKGRNLLKADELNQTYEDSSSIWYYFKREKLLKIDARVLIGNQLFHQNFYFKNGKLIYSTPLENSPFNPKTYLNRSKKYLKFKSKIYSPSIIRDYF